MALKLQAPQVLVYFFWAFFGTALFSLKSIFIKLAYAEGLNTDSVLMLRMAISLPIYLAILLRLASRAAGNSPELRPHFLRILFLGFIGYFLASWLDLKGLETISAGLERLTLFTYPIFVALLGALFFNTPLSKKIIITLLLTYSGLWVIFSQELESGGGKTATGVMFVTLSALSYSFYVLFSKRVIHAIGAAWFTALAMSVSCLIALLYYSVSLDWAGLTISRGAWLWVFLLATVSTVLPSFMISAAIKGIGAAQTGIVGTLGPIFTIGLAVFILNEPFTGYHAVGIALVVGGVLLLTLRRAPEISASKVVS